MGTIGRFEYFSGDAGCVGAEHRDAHYLREREASGGLACRIRVAFYHLGSYDGSAKRTPFGTWQFRFVDWFKDLGFPQEAGGG